MPYATQEQIVERYGADAVTLLADRDGDGQPDAEVVAQSLDDATAEIDSYLATKYDLPLPRVPEVLVRICVDIAVYRLAPEIAEQTDERRLRYEDAVRLLKSLAKGETSLGLDDPPPSSFGAVTVSGGPRRFTRDKLRGVL